MDDRIAKKIAEELKLIRKEMERNNKSKEAYVPESVFLQTIEGLREELTPLTREQQIKQLGRPIK